MTLRDLRIGWRHFLQQPFHSFFVVLGLAVGFAVAILLFAYVRFSTQYDAHVPDADSVYYVKQRFNVDQEAWFDNAPLLLYDVAAAHPGVAAVAASHIKPTGLAVRLGDTVHTVRCISASPDFPAMVGMRTVDGDVAAALASPDGLVLTEDTAAQWFGGERAIGKLVPAEGKTLRVLAVVKAPPANTMIPFQAMHGLRSVMFPPDLIKGIEERFPMIWFKIHVRMRPGASPADLATAMQKAVDSHPMVVGLPADLRARLGDRKAMDIRLAPLRSAYFDSDIGGNHFNPERPYGNPAAIAGLAAVAALILLLAAANYVNLATVRVLHRQREIGMRKALGADGRRLALQFIGESMLVTLAATSVGLLLAWLLLAPFSALVVRNLAGMMTWQHVAAVYAAAVLLGLACAVQPARTALRVPPSRVLTGRAHTEPAGGRRLRLALTVVQFAAAIGLAAITLAIEWQTRHAVRSDPGFDPAPLISIDVHETYDSSARHRALVDDLRRIPGVAGVTTSLDAVGRHLDVLTQPLRREGGVSISLQKKVVGREFFEVYGVRPLAGRTFDARTDGESEWQKVVVNETAVRQLGYPSNEEAVGKWLYNDGHDGKTYQRQIIGVVPDIRFESLREAARPAFFEPGRLTYVVTLRVQGPLAPVEQAVETLWARHFTDAELEMRPAEEFLAYSYAEDAHIATLLGIAATIAIAIAAFGMYVMSAHTVQRRTREIVVRKLYGARRRHVAGLVARELGRLCAMAALIGLPLAAIGISRYLAPFVERSPHAYLALPAALAAGLAIAALAAARHTWLAMKMAPADALRE